MNITLLYKWSSYLLPSLSREGLGVGFFLLVSLTFSSCNDWLDILPNNEQVTDDYWKSKEDVEAVVASGYYYMRQCVPTYIKWGELRGGTLYTTATSDAKLQDFNMLPSNSLCDWSNIYKVIGHANSIIKYAPSVNDNTYYDANRNSHLCEAYFMRAYSYLLLAKNYKDLPLVVEPYVNDKTSFDIAKSSEEQVIEQVKADVKNALATGAAKATYEEDWQTKGRATKWALYALMADACLWSEDYDLCINYCDSILNATDVFRPVFMSNTQDWYSLYYPGNSNESIFELNWDYTSNNEKNNFAGLFSGQTLRLTNTGKDAVMKETQTLKDKGVTEDGRMGRMLLATYVPEGSIVTAWPTATNYVIWKYAGIDVADITGGVRQNQDANFIIYRVAEVMLMKAQALAMKGEGSWSEAVSLVNKIRQRAGLDDFSTNISSLDELTLLQEILHQKNMEFIAEGKRWYDVLWLGRIGQGKYKEEFINMVIDGNQTTNRQWILSVLQDQNAWYMPLPQDDIEHNKLLEQNPYYGTTK